MKFPCWLVSVWVLWPGLCLAATKTQSFDSEASATAAGWTGQNANTNGNSYGFSATNFAAGASSGEAGGTIARAGAESYYADLSIGGPYTRTAALSASGALVVTTISKSPPFNGTFTVGHFNRVTPSNAQLGFNLAEDDAGSLRFAAVITMPDHPGLSGNTLVLTHLLKTPRHWSYSWDPSGGAEHSGRLVVTIDGVGGGSSTVDLPAADAGTALAVDAFGITSPHLVNPDANKLVAFFIDDLAYSEANEVPATSSYSYAILFLLLGSVCGLNIWRRRKATSAMGEDTRITS